MIKTKTEVECIEDGIASVEIEGVLYNINIENKFEEWLEEKATGLQNDLTTEELEFQTRTFTSELLKETEGLEQLVVEWVDNNEITSEIESVFNCCGNEQTYSEDSTMCKDCFEHFI